MELQGYQVCDFAPDDYESVKELWRFTGVSGVHRADDLKVIQASLQSGGHLWLIRGFAPRAVLGTCWITCDGRRLYLHHLTIHPQHQKKGLGRFFVQRSMNLALGLKIQIKLEVRADNDSAVRLYQKCGFELLDDYQTWICRDPTYS